MVYSCKKVVLVKEKGPVWALLSVCIGVVWANALGITEVAYGNLIEAIDAQKIGFVKKRKFPVIVWV